MEVYMGSVSSVNTGVTDLLQTLTRLNSPVMSSKTAVSALEKAPAADIVQLSAAANQLQSVDAMFGISTTPNSDMSSTLTALESLAAGSTGITTPPALSNASPADLVANGQAALQAQLTQGLFGTGTNNSLSGSLFNAIA
jgi:hypothetical protein